MIAFVLGTALAARVPLPDTVPHPPQGPRHDTAGFRVVAPVGASGVSTRVALVEDFDGPFLAEMTIRAQMAWPSFGLAAEVAGTAGASGIWSGAGVGNAVLDARTIFGGRVTHAFGLRVTAPLGDRGSPAGPVAWWGTVPIATVPALTFALAWDTATDRFIAHAHLGAGSTGWTEPATGVDAALSVATVQPLARGWSAIGELELLTQPSPVHLRGLARRELAHGWTLDGGLAVPIVAFIRDPTLEVVFAARRVW